MRKTAARVVIGVFVLFGVGMSALAVEAGFGYDGLLCEMGITVGDTSDGCGS